MVTVQVVVVLVLVPLRLVVLLVELHWLAA